MMFGVPRLYAMIGIGVAVALFLAWVARIDHLRAAHLKQYQAEHAAYVQFQADVKAKTELARIADAAHKAEVERDQNKVTMEVSNDYQAQLADLRRRYAALQLRNNAKANSGGGRSSAMPGVPNTASGADDTAPQAGLPPEDALIASEQALQLKGLQDWVRGQEAVER